MKEFGCILGIALCLEEDLKSLLNMIDFIKIDFMVIGLDCSDRVTFDIQHIATYHVEELGQFRLRRQKINGNLDYMTHSHKQPKNGEQADYVWPLVAKSPFSGSSSFLGVQGFVGLDYKKIILCGCPMQGKNLINKRATAYDKFQKGWVKFAPLMFGDKIRSMSGWTKEFLGYPTKEWLYE